MDRTRAATGWPPLDLMENPINQPVTALSVFRAEKYQLIDLAQEINFIPAI
jgi:hypothetical protein